MRNIVDIFRDVVAGLTKTVSINGMSISGTTYTFSVNRTYWARPNSRESLATKVTMLGTEYNIASVVYNTSISVTTADDLSAATTLTIAAPTYINGTRIAVQNERKRSNSWQVCPFVWLVEPFVASDNKDPLSIIASEPDLSILFLDNMSKDWQTGEHYSNVILPMDEVAEAFYQALENDRATFGRVTSWRVVRHAVFGQETANGHVSSFINEKTSGVEVRFSVEILKSLNCN